MVMTSSADGLLDRQAEREVFDRFLESVRGGQSSVLVARRSVSASTWPPHARGLPASRNRSDCVIPVTLE